MKTLSAFLISTLLAACQPSLVSGGTDSGVRRLALGMTYAQVVDVLGPHQSGNIRAGMQGPTCLSWVYDETTYGMFIHVLFEDGVLIKADDAHHVPCSPRS